MNLKMVDYVPGGGRVSRDWEAPAPRLTLRELIAERVRRDVDAFNEQHPEGYHGLVAPEESELILNGYPQVKRVRALDSQNEVRRTERAFESNGFLVFANGVRLHSLDAEIDVATAGELEFVKLVNSAGG
ncbi:MAG TPA: hypothetical protein VKR61_07585 [Bryobacteraceae bacterium]|nr:hypothetical protein [Bryobacteraceae bacterium]